LEFAFVVAEAGLIDSAHLPEHLFRDHPTAPAANHAGGNEASEKKALIAALEQAGGNKTRAARILGVSRATVWNRMHKYAITLEKTVRP
jgi:transcriptional regulator of acetoin/glycerol metabolism